MMTLQNNLCFTQWATSYNSVGFDYDHIRLQLQRQRLGASKIFCSHKGFTQKLKWLKPLVICSRQYSNLAQKIIISPYYVVKPFVALILLHTKFDTKSRVFFLSIFLRQLDTLQEFKACLPQGPF